MTFDPTTFKTLAEFGVPTAVLLIVLLFGLKYASVFTAQWSDQQSKLLAVVENNTVAMTKVAGTLQGECDDIDDMKPILARTEAAAVRIEVTVSRNEASLSRVENKVDYVTEIVRGQKT